MSQDLIKHRHVIFFCKATMKCIKNFCGIEAYDMFEALAGYKDLSFLSKNN